MLDKQLVWSIKKSGYITVSYQRKITPYEINVNFDFFAFKCVNLQTLISTTIEILDMQTRQKFKKHR